MKVIYPLTHFWSHCEKAIFNRWLQIEKQKKQSQKEGERLLPSFRKGGSEEWERSGFVFDRGEGGEGIERGSKESWERVEAGLEIWERIDERVKQKKRLLTAGLDRQAEKETKSIRELVEWMTNEVFFFLFFFSFAFRII